MTESVLAMVRIQLSQSVTHSRTHAGRQARTHAPTHPLTQPRTHSLTHSRTLSFARPSASLPCRTVRTLCVTVAGVGCLQAPGVVDCDLQQTLTVTGLDLPQKSKSVVEATPHCTESMRRHLLENGSCSTSNSLVCLRYYDVLITRWQPNEHEDTCILADMLF